MMSSRESKVGRQDEKGAWSTGDTGYSQTVKHEETATYKDDVTQAAHA